MLPAQHSQSPTNSSLTLWAPPDLLKLLRSKAWFAWATLMGRMTQCWTGGKLGSSVGVGRGCWGGIWDGNEDERVPVSAAKANGGGTAWAAPCSLWEKNLEFGMATAGGGNEVGFKVPSTQTSL